MPSPAGTTLLATHARAVGHGARVVDERHWDGLPDGSSRRTTTGEPSATVHVEALAEEEAGPLTALLHRSALAGIEVGRRPLSVYDQLTGTRPFTVTLPTEPEELR